MKKKKMNKDSLKSPVKLHSGSLSTDMDFSHSPPDVTTLSRPWCKSPSLLSNPLSRLREESPEDVKILAISKKGSVGKLLKMMTLIGLCVPIPLKKKKNGWTPLDKSKECSPSLKKNYNLKEWPLYKPSNPISLYNTSKPDPTEKKFPLKSKQIPQFQNPTGKISKIGQPVPSFVEEVLKHCTESVLWEPHQMPNLVRESQFWLNPVTKVLAPLLPMEKNPKKFFPWKLKWRESPTDPKDMKPVSSRKEILKLLEMILEISKDPLESLPELSSITTLSPFSNPLTSTRSFSLVNSQTYKCVPMPQTPPVSPSPTPWKEPHSPSVPSPPSWESPWSKTVTNGSKPSDSSNPTAKNPSSKSKTRPSLISSEEKWKWKRKKPNKEPLTRPPTRALKWNKSLVWLSMPSPRNPSMKNWPKPKSWIEKSWKSSSKENKSNNSNLPTNVPRETRERPEKCKKKAWPPTLLKPKSMTWKETSRIWSWTKEPILPRKLQSWRNCTIRTRELEPIKSKTWESDSPRKPWPPPSLGTWSSVIHQSLLLIRLNIVTKTLTRIQTLTRTVKTLNNIVWSVAKMKLEPNTLPKETIAWNNAKEVVNPEIGFGSPLPMPDRKSVV